MENTINIAEKIKSMTAKEIIMSMMNGLRNPVTKIDMGTFGNIVEDVYFGCAATNALCYIGNYSVDDLLVVPRLEGSDAEIALQFEWAIDELRQGNIDGYNYYAKKHFAHILLPDGITADDLFLPYLYNDFTEAELECYVRLAEMQS